MDKDSPSPGDAAAGPAAAAAAAQHSSPSSEPQPDEPISISITVIFAGQTKTFSLAATHTIDDLTLECEEAWGQGGYDWTSHKFIAPPPTGLIKATERADMMLAPLAGKKLRLLAPKLGEVEALRAAAASARHIAERRAAQRQRQRRHAGHGHYQHRRSNQAQTEAESRYNFREIRPLAGLPNPERSHDFLVRLARDPGIRAAMVAHKFTVGLLTEMDPLSYTQESHEGTTRILGLNRNQGDIIELRLRTDRYDGYRDYKTIRKTLCHELAHNVHGPHDRNFWDLCHQIEREVDRADWKSGGRTIGDGPTYDPGERDDEDIIDHGGLTSGEAVLGGGGNGSSSSSTSGGGGSSSAALPTGLSRREILAKAAEERLRRMNNDERRDAGNGEGGGGGGGGGGANKERSNGSSSG